MGQCPTKPVGQLIVRNSSLSAIHRGLRRSERARPQGPQLSRAAQQIVEKRRERREAPPPTFRLLRGKKDITEKTGPETKTRRARFYDPEDGFGKKSLVYQMKSGQLQAQLKELGAKRDSPSRDSSLGSRSAGLRRPERDTTRRLGSAKRGDWEDGKLDVQKSAYGKIERNSQSSDFLDRFSRSDDDTRRQMPRQDGRTYARRDPRADSEGRRTRAGRENRGDTPSRPVKDTPAPVSIPYTTAASQFLYGKSVVEAALQTSRRKLYKLYIYSGANRQNIQRDMVIEKLAQRQGVQIVNIDESGQRMMEKMSLGRPHNGYILEASPLPQQPLASLGEAAKVGGRSGYKIELGHQSSEEAAVNGTSDFVPTASGTHKPLVLMLDQVLDPGNLGAILRTASFLGVNAVAISKKSSASLTPVALKASAGACEALTLFSIEAPANFLAQSKKAGWKIYAAVPAATRSTRRKQVDLEDVETSDPLHEDPCVLVVGSEGEGLPRAIKSQADYEVNIPNQSGSGVVDSLNVSVATALLCSSFLKQQTKSLFKEHRQDDLGIW